MSSTPLTNGNGPSTTTPTTMKININIAEKDVIKLIIEFLANRDLNISMLDLERETGVINAAYSDDILFLRQLILDGQWDDALEFIQPLKQIESFNSKQFHFLIMKYQYLELLCLKSEANTIDNQLSVDQLVTYLNDLRPYCPSDEEYKKLCLLLTASRLQDHTEYRLWNPSSGRLQCFKDILPLVNKFLTVTETNTNNPNEAKTPKDLIAQNERLIQLIVKGLLYESCVEYCQARATSSIETYNLSDANILLMQMHLSETDASLLSWLHALPIDTFSCPFEEKPLKLGMDRFVKPNLEATWADAILATPIKPQQLFPYNAVPTGRSRNTELMSRSLAPQYEGLSFGLSKSQIFTSGIEMKLNGAGAGVGGGTTAGGKGGGSSQSKSGGVGDLNDITRSIALFNIDTRPSSNSNGTISNGYNGSNNGNLINPNSILTASLYGANQMYPTVLNGIKEEEFPIANNNNNSTMSGSSSSSSSNTTSNSVTPSNKKTTKMTAPIATLSSPPLSNSVGNNGGSNVNNNKSYSSNPMQDSTLFKEYQKNKAQIIQQLEEQDRKRDEFVKQLKSPNVYNALNAVSKSQTKNQNNKQSSVNDTQIISPNDLTLTNNNLDEESFLSPKSSKRIFNASLSSKTNGGNDIQSPTTNMPKTPLSPLDNRTLTSPRDKNSNNYNNNNNKPSLKSERPNLSFNKSNATDTSFNERPINDTIKYDSLEDIMKAASFQPICMIEDQQAIRAVDIHPSGNYYVVGSNSKCLRICPYPNLNNIRSDTPCKAASVLYKKGKHHYGSIYCTAWNIGGNLIATGSNDKTIKLVKFTPDLAEDTDSEVELTYHNGTIRDLIFMHQEENNILVSGGAGDCKIQVLDCQTQQTLRSYTGHTGHIYTLYTWSGTKNVFVSGSQDKTCRFWDLRAPEAIQTIVPTTTLALQGSPVAAVAVDPSGLLLSTGHEDAACCLYDIRGSRIVQIYKPHTSDIRSVRFSTNAYYLLTASYDNKVIITDLHGDLTKPLNWSVVAQHNDKIIQARWHPTQMSIITTSADRTSIVWSLPSAALAGASVV